MKHRFKLLSAKDTQNVHRLIKLSQYSFLYGGMLNKPTNLKKQNSKATFKIPKRKTLKNLNRTCLERTTKKTPHQFEMKTKTFLKSLLLSTTKFFIETSTTRKKDFIISKQD